MCGYFGLSNFENINSRQQNTAGLLSTGCGLHLISPEPDRGGGRREFDINEMKCGIFVCNFVSSLICIKAQIY